MVDSVIDHLYMDRLTTLHLGGGEGYGCVICTLVPFKLHTCQVGHNCLSRWILFVVVLLSPLHCLDRSRTYRPSCPQLRHGDDARTTFRRARVLVSTLYSLGPNHTVLPMPVRIRLALHGCTNRPFYHVVVAPSKAPRNGRHLEQVRKSMDRVYIYACTYVV